MAIIKKSTCISRNANKINSLASIFFSVTIWIVSQDFSKFEGSWNSHVLVLMKSLSPNNESIAIWLVLFLSGFVAVMTMPFMVNIFFRKPKENFGWLRFFVERARDRAYRQLEEALPNHHRVTLFKYVDKLPKGYVHWTYLQECRSKKFIFNIWKRRSGKYSLREGWLVPVMRSGFDDRYCLSSTVFVASRNNTTFEGVVGKAWSLKSTVVQKALPEVTSSNGNNRKRYADDSGCDRKQIDFMLSDTQDGEKKILPRTIGAIVLVNQKGKAWGVLVFDSRSDNAFPDGINNALALNEMFSTTIKGMSKALGGG